MPPRGPRAAARAQLVEVLQNSATETAALGVDEMAALLPVLQAARAELNRDLGAWLSQGKGTERWTPQAYRQSLLAIEAAEQTAETLLRGGLLNALTMGDAAARALANTHTARELLAHTDAAGLQLLPSVPVKVAHTLVAGRHAPMERYETSAARYAGQVRRDIRRHLAVGVVRGENNDQLVARLRAHGGPRGVVAVRGIAGQAGALLEVIPEGLFARYEYWAERIVRTELAHAYTEQVADIRRELLDDFPDMVRRWDAAADMRTCPRCGEMHGALSDTRTDLFPGGVDVPLHPNCRCRAGLFRPEWARHMPAGSVQAPPTTPPEAPTPAPRPNPPPAPAPAPVTPPVRRPRVPELPQPAWTAPRPRIPEAPQPAWTPRPPPPAPAPAPRPPRVPTAKAPRAPASAVLAPPARKAFTNALGALAGPQARLAALGVDAGEMAAALGAVPELALKATTFPVLEGAPREAMAAVRTNLRGLLNRWCGVVTRPTPTPGSSRGGLGFWINDALNAIRARASHSFTGVVEVLRTVTEEARSGFAALAAGRQPKAVEWNAIKTLIHEELHGCSPLVASACTRHGVVWEEITTEVLARAAVRDLSGLGEAALPEAHFNFGRWSQDHWFQWHHDNAVQGSYARIIGRGISMLANELRITPQEAVSLIERATILQRRAHSKRPVTADGYVSDLARRLLEVHANGATVDGARVRKLTSMMSSTRFAMTSGAMP